MGGSPELGSGAILVAGIMNFSSGFVGKKGLGAGQGPVLIAEHPRL